MGLVIEGMQQHSRDPLVVGYGLQAVILLAQVDPKGEASNCWDWGLG